LFLLFLTGVIVSTIIVFLAWGKPVTLVVPDRAKSEPMAALENVVVNGASINVKQLISDQFSKVLD
jgi:hypothetical protein